jgi:23S rRNA (uracil1939-C5)-methyltransferase
MKQLTILKLGQQGDGLAEDDDGFLHIPKTLAGEIVEWQPGQSLKIIEAAPERVNAFCKHFDRCGGCKFQHWAETPYKVWKRNMLVEALASKGLATDIAPLVDAHGLGRRRVSLHVRLQDDVWVAGFMQLKSHNLIALDHCPVLVPALQNAAAIAAAFGSPLGACDVALTAADNGLDVSVKAERAAVPRRREALVEIARQHNILRLTVNGETFLTREAPVVAMGKAHVPLPLASFLQATKRGEEVLSALVVAHLKSAKHIADLFCGAGPFALRLAENAKISSIDNDKPAIASLQSAIRNTQGLKPLQTSTRDLFREPLTALELKPFDAVVLDPPRAGAEAQVRILAKSTVKRVVMVSCDIATFTRDAAILVAGGYKFKNVTPVDQFKWTAHLEMVGLFQR